MDSNPNIEKRKEEHLKICVDRPVEQDKGNGFEGVELAYNPLPETDLEGIDPSTTFLGKEFRYPLFISAMTGGCSLGKEVNLNLARAAEDLGIGMGLGSQRAALENPELMESYQVREVAENIFLLGNIGAVQMKDYTPKDIRQLIESVGADGMGVHLNPLQEVLQVEGDTDWKGVLKEIKRLTSELDLPVVVKETGCGLTGPAAEKLERAGAAALDTGGAGGTSWARVEYYRGSEIAKNFFQYGLETAESLKQCRKAVKIPVIASGGIRNGLEAAKALAIGADLVGMALPLLEPATESAEAVKRRLERVVKELKISMFLSGAGDLEELRGKYRKV